MLLLLSVMVRVADRVPLAVGANVTLTVQLPFAARELPQVVVSPKSVELAPEIAMPLIDKATLPVLFRVKLCAALVVPTVWLPNTRLVAVMPAIGLLPVPARLTVCGLPPALSAMLTEAVRFPMPPGVNATLIVQLAFAATEPGHVLVTAKSPGSVPVAPILVIAKAPFPLLVSVTVWAALVVFKFWLAKVRDPTERLTAGPLPVPVSDTVCGLLARLSAMLTDATRTPGAVGENFTMIWQLAFCANVPGQLFV
jgi:hypothetical protein